MLLTKYQAANDQSFQTCRHNPLFADGRLQTADIKLCTQSFIDTAHVGMLKQPVQIQCASDMCHASYIYIYLERERKHMRCSNIGEQVLGAKRRSQGQAVRC